MRWWLALVVSLVTVFHLKAESEPGIQDELRNIKQYSTHTLLGVSCDIFLNRYNVSIETIR